MREEATSPNQIEDDVLLYDIADEALEAAAEPRARQTGTDDGEAC